MGSVQLYRIVDALLDTDIALSYAWKGADVIPPRTLPPQALVIGLTPLLDERSVGALLDLRARGFDLAIVDVSPLPFLPPERDRLERLFAGSGPPLRSAQARVPAAWSGSRRMAGRGGAEQAIEEVRLFGAPHEPSAPDRRGRLGRCQRGAGGRRMAPLRPVGGHDRRHSCGRRRNSRRVTDRTLFSGSAAGPRASQAATRPRLEAERSTSISRPPSTWRSSSWRLSSPTGRSSSPRDSSALGLVVRRVLFLAVTRSPALAASCSRRHSNASAGPCGAGARSRWSHPGYGRHRSAGATFPAALERMHHRSATLQSE